MYRNAKTRHLCRALSEQLKKLHQEVEINFLPFKPTQILLLKPFLLLICDQMDNISSKTKHVSVAKYYKINLNNLGL